MAFLKSLLIALGAVCLPQALACGDKLVGLGGGVPYARVQSQARLQGFVVLLAPRGSDLYSYNETSRLGQILQRAGHRVQTVESGSALVNLLATANADVVLTDDSAANSLRGQIPEGRSAPSVLGLIARPVSSTAGAPTFGNCQISASAKQSGRVAREVERIIKRRQTGAAIDCASGGNRT